MSYLSSVERKERKARDHRTRCVSMKSRVEALVAEGCPLHEAKQRVADEFGVTLVTVYNDLRWLKRYEQLNNDNDNSK